MKSVFNNRMVAHVWAQQNQVEGRNSNGQFYFKNATIYSYRDSFPLAAFHGGKILTNDDTYSVTTSKHQGYVRQAINYDRANLIHMNTETLRLMLDYSGKVTTNTTAALKAFEEYTADKVETHLRNAAGRKKESLKHDDLQAALYCFLNAELFYGLFKKKIPAKLLKTWKDIKTKKEDVLKKHADIIAKERKAATAAKLQREKAEQEKLAEETAKFRAGESYSLYNSPETLLRAKGENIETSRGAEFPVSFAKRAWKQIKACKDGGIEWHTNGHSIPLGTFKIDSIDTAGNVKAGCHTVTYSEIERLAQELNL